MKLYEIKGFDKGVKVRDKSWDKEEYIYFDSDFWLDKNGNHYDHYIAVFFHHTNWEVYEEQKVAKLDKKDIIDVLNKEIDELSSALHSLNSALINIKYLREKIKED